MRDASLGIIRRTAMLVLTRRSEESIMLGGNIEVKVLNIRGDQVSLGFTAPQEIGIYRKEVYDAIEAENRQSCLEGEDELTAIRKKMGRPGPDARHPRTGSDDA
jgi:carbon storage regulator